MNPFGEQREDWRNALTNYWIYTVAPKGKGTRLKKPEQFKVSFSPQDQLVSEEENLDAKILAIFSSM